MLKKKSTKKQSSKDFTELDSAVSELSKQTDALLGSFKEQEPEKETKPTLPKKQAVAHPRAKHFDIIHDPKHTTKLHATLKTVPKVQKAEKELPLPAEELSQPELKESKTAIVLTHKQGSLHATAKNSSKKKESEPVAESDASTVGVKKPTKPNASNALSFDEADDANVAVKSQPEEPAPEPENEVPEARVEVESDAPAESVSAEAENQQNNTEPAKNLPTDDKPEEASPKVDKDAQQPDTKPVDAEAATPEAEEKTEDESSDDTQSESNAYRGELYANNLVKEAEPKGYQPKDGEEKPALFDTEEYHPELHDWSKLEHKSGLSWLGFLLVLVIAGALAYVILTGQKLPFIS